MPMTRLSFLTLSAAVALALTAAACAADETVGAPTPSPATRVAGRVFDVVALGERALPAEAALAGRGACSTGPVGRVRLAFFADGTFELTLWAVPAASGPGAVFRSSYTQSPAGAVALSDSGRAGSGTLRGDTLTLHFASVPFCAPYILTAVPAGPA